jgi:hypothetical protein
MQLVTACLCCDTSSWRTVTYSIVHLKSWGTVPNPTEHHGERDLTLEDAKSALT